VSYDHRLVGGAHAAQFLVLVKRLFETGGAAEHGV
jgi:pyruvate/2-oxoglutarate dehydrogenase complex dihydrolipoamide acyltransferase (E2) component